MAENPDIQAILAALASSQSHAGPQTQAGSSMPPYHSSGPNPPPPAAHYPSAPAIPTPPSYHAPSYALPQPAATGNVDLSNVRPVGSGTVSIADSIAQARAFAAERGVTSYDRPLVYAAGGNRSADSRPYQSRSRSRSPQARREGGSKYRDNPYRDERRGRGGGGGGDDRGGDDRGGRRDVCDRSYSPGPRDRDRDGRGQNRGGRSGAGGGGGSDDNSEIIPIESSLVGLIIGRQGENLRRIEGETGCRVQFLPPSPEQTSFRQCKISGPAPLRSQVKDSINKIIDDNGMGALNRQVDRSRAGPEMRDGEDHIKMSVPDRTVGLIIGRGGETIRDLQEKSGCHINIVDEKQSINGLRPVNLIGTPEAARMARMLILQIVETDNQSHDPVPSRNGSGKPGNAADFGHGGPPGGGGGGMNGSGGAGGDKVNDKMYVPSDTVGMIIGKGGETIRDIQQQTGCKINVMQAAPGAAPDSQREINLVGSRDSIEHAKAAIFEKVDVARQRGGGGGASGGAGAPRGRPNNTNGNINGSGGYSQGRNDYHDAYAPQPGNTSAHPTAAGGASAAGANGADPYAPWGGYDQYVRACWAYMQQQQAAGTPAPAGAAAPSGQ